VDIGKATRERKFLQLLSDIFSNTDEAMKREAGDMSRWPSHKPDIWRNTDRRRISYFLSALTVSWHPAHRTIRCSIPVKFSVEDTP